MTDLLIVIPARGGSKRLPGKHTRLLAGRNLLQHTQRAIDQAALGAPVLLTTDDAEIAAGGRALGWQAPFLRPAELAGDDVPTLPVLQHALDWYRQDSGADPGSVLLLQTTSPLRPCAMPLSCWPSMTRSTLSSAFNVSASGRTGCFTATKTAVSRRYRHATPDRRSSFRTARFI